MLPEPFTTDDGDVILRAGPDAGSKHDFRVHKIVLSLLSPVFKGLFQVAQPDSGREGPLPIIPITDSPESVDLLLRFVYPGRVPPIITDPSALSDLMTIADKYDLPAVSQAVKERLADEKILETDPFGVYAVARRWGFSVEAKEAARGMTLAKVTKSPSSRDPRSIASDDFLRLVWFMQERGDAARNMIRKELVPVRDDPDYDYISCGKHTDGGCRRFYERLAEVIVREFNADPCLDVGKLVMAMATTLDPPHTGFCDQNDPPEAAEYFSIYCPLQPSLIISRLNALALQLGTVCDQYLRAALDGKPPF